MEPMTGPSLLGEVRDFLSSLRVEWPEIFAPAKRRVPAAVTVRPKADDAVRPKAEAPAPAAVAVVLPGSGSQFVAVPSVAVDAPLKSSIAEGDLAALFRSRAEHWAPLLGVTFNRLSVKDQRTLWGSCTREGNLNFSWRLALAPDSVLDYLIVHELSHRAQMNHSRRFWEVVERVCPHHRSHRRWLRRNAAALHAAKRPV